MAEALERALMRSLGLTSEQMAEVDDLAGERGHTEDSLLQAINQVRDAPGVLSPTTKSRRSAYLSALDSAFMLSPAVIRSQEAAPEPVIDAPEPVIDAAEAGRIPDPPSGPRTRPTFVPPHPTYEPVTADEPTVDDPIASSPAVRASAASTRMDRGILEGGIDIEDDEGWSYKYFPDSGKIQIVTAPDANRTAIGMVLDSDSAGRNKEYYEAIVKHSKSAMAAPEVTTEDVSAVMAEGKPIAEGAPEAMAEGKPTAEAAPATEQEATVSPQEGRRAQRALRDRPSGERDPKTIANRILARWDLGTDMDEVPGAR